MHNRINMHSHKHSLNMFITFININYGCKRKNGKDHLSYKNSFCNQLRCYNVPPNHRLACSLISQQCCHPRVGNDSPRNKEQACLHIAKDKQNIQGFTIQPSQQSWVYHANERSAKPTQLGLSDHPRARKG